MSEEKKQGLPDQPSPVFLNRGLFSDHFLKARLPQWKEWETDEGLATFHKELMSLYESTKPILPTLNEAQTEKEFIQPLLDLLGYANSYIVQAPTKVGQQTNRPDYALFPDETTKNKAYQKLKSNEYTQCIGVADAKYWERELDLAKSSEQDTLANQNPSFQIVSYLTGTQQRWGILTNGRLWRLYCTKSHLPLGNYYQVDLVQLLEAPEENLKYFYLFFRKAALIQIDGKSFLDHVLEGSNEYAVELEADIKERAYEVVELLCRGFTAGFPHEQLTDATLKSIYDNSLTLLYRLLFVFYAEARELLPLTTSVSYRDNYSMRKITHDIDEVIRKGQQLTSQSTIYYQRIGSLFGLINTGDPGLGVPEYNGGLFDLEEHPFLEEHAIADAFLARAIYQLAQVTDKKLGREVAVDYNTLSERHLGSIYEGLLEFKPRIAPYDLVTIREKGSLKYAPANKYPDKKIAYKKSELYLANDKGERKASGSYYTPEYIVNYIVENTLDPLVKEAQDKIKALKPEVDKATAKWQKLKEQKQGLEPTDKYDRAIAEERERLFEPYLSLKVLDPAMGSGHFLARATDFLAEAIATDPSIESPIELTEESELTYYRRRVVESCIYGVDLNPLAVELAKLTLWLGTMAKSKPLSFLNHHLRVGNSLIGAKVADLDEIPKRKGKKGRSLDLSRAPVQLRLFQEAFNKKLYDLLQYRALIAQLPTETLEDIHSKERWERDFEHNAERFRTLADIWVSTYFDNNVRWDEYNALVENLQSTQPEWGKLLQKEYVKKALVMREERHFFHWELEFPEVFYNEQGNRKSAAGFDAVVGNPPYRKTPEFDIYPYVKDNFALPTKSDPAELFIERALKLSRLGGRSSLIVPKPLTYTISWKKTRSLLKDYRIERLADCYEAFDDVLLEQVVYVIANAPAEKSKVIPACRVDSKFEEGTPFSVRYFSEDFLPMHITPQTTILYDHVWAVSVRLDSVANLWEGPGYNQYLSDDPAGLPCFKGDHVARYEILNIAYLPQKMTPPDTEMYREEKGILQRIVAHVTKPFPRIIIMASIDDTGSLTVNTLTDFVGRQVSTAFLVAIMNSRFTSWYAYDFIFNQAVRSMDLYPAYVGRVPIRRISFTTPEGERKQLLKQGKGLYQEYLQSQDWSKVLAFVAQRLPQKPDGAPDMEHEQSDVAHDLLAFLAEEMTRLHKKKQSRIKDFLNWLEKEVLKGSVENQKNKTKIKDFHENTFEDLLDILKKNRAIPDPCPSNTRDTVAGEFIATMTVLTPLKTHIRATDTLIDQMVYRLYGLTDEEIAMVEGQHT